MLGTVALCLCACQAPEKPSRVGEVASSDDQEPGGKLAYTPNPSYAVVDSRAGCESSRQPLAEGPDNLHGFQPSTAVAATPCQLQQIEPQVIGPTDTRTSLENVKIIADGKPAISITGKSGFRIRNCEIWHRNASGIRFEGVNGLTIENCRIGYLTPPAFDPARLLDSLLLPALGFSNVVGVNSTNVQLVNLQVSNGSNGIFLSGVKDARLRYIEAHDPRGGLIEGGGSGNGHCVQFSNSENNVLEDFSCECNPASSRCGDNLSVLQSRNITIRRGMVQGNNSAKGVGVMFEHSFDKGQGGLVEDVDTIDMINGAFAAFPARWVTWRRVRAKNNICTAVGAAPASNARFLFVGSHVENGNQGDMPIEKYGNLQSCNLFLLDARYETTCGAEPPVWNQAAFRSLELRKEAFTARAPLRLIFCWDQR